jgi:hypothetical protein
MIPESKPQTSDGLVQIALLVAQLIAQSGEIKEKD